jgi:hypothetical protein
LFDLPPALAGFLGAIVGAAASVGAIWIQAHVKDQRDRIRQATDLGMAEFKLRLEIARDRERSTPLPPPWLYVWFNWDVLKAMETGDLSEAKVKELLDRHDALAVKMRARESGKSVPP